jgi:hypothetical protein
MNDSMLTTIPAASATYHRDLGDGLILRWSTADDTEKIAQLCSIVFRNKADEPASREYIKKPCMRSAKLNAYTAFCDKFATMARSACDKSLLHFHLEAGQGWLES